MFRVIKNMKLYIETLDDTLINFPKKEKVLTDSIKKISYEILELIFLANIIDDKYETKKIIVSKINMLNFYIELAYKKHYLSEKQCLNKCDELLKINKMIYGWIKNA